MRPRAGMKPRDEAVAAWRLDAIDKAYDGLMLEREDLEPGARGFWVEWEEVESFPNVSPEIPEGGWRDIISTKWQYEEPQARLKARAGALALEAAVRNPESHFIRLVILGDAMGSLLGFEKGRSSAQGERGACLKISALSLLSGCEASWRWIPSERNSADPASRNYAAEKSTDHGKPSPVGPAASRVHAEIRDRNYEWGAALLDEAERARFNACRRAGSGSGRQRRSSDDQQSKDSVVLPYDSHNKGVESKLGGGPYPEKPRGPESKAEGFRCRRERRRVGRYEAQREEAKPGGSSQTSFSRKSCSTKKGWRQYWKREL